MQGRGWERKEGRGAAEAAETALFAVCWLWPPKGCCFTHLASLIYKP